MAQDAPPYTFVAKNGRVAWDTVLNFNVQPFLDGSNVSPRDLEALDEVARRVEEARIEPEPNVPADEMAARLAQLADRLAARVPARAPRFVPAAAPSPRSSSPSPIQRRCDAAPTPSPPQDLQAAVQKKDEELDVMDEQIEAMEQRRSRRRPRWRRRRSRAQRARSREFDAPSLSDVRSWMCSRSQLDRPKEDARRSKRALDEATRARAQAEDDVKEMLRATSRRSARSNPRGSERKPPRDSARSSVTRRWRGIRRRISFWRRRTDV